MQVVCEDERRKKCQVTFWEKVGNRGGGKGVETWEVGVDREKSGRGSGGAGEKMGVRMEISDGRWRWEGVWVDGVVWGVSENKNKIGENVGEVKLE